MAEQLPGMSTSAQARTKAAGFTAQEPFDAALLLANTYNRLRMMKTWYSMDEAVRTPPGQEPFESSQATRTVGRMLATTGIPQFMERAGGESDTSARRQLFWNSMLPMIAIEFMFNVSGKQTTDREREVFLKLFPNALQSSNVNDAFFDGILDTVKRGLETRAKTLSPDQRAQMGAVLRSGAKENTDLLQNRTLEFLESQGGQIPIDALPFGFRRFVTQARVLQSNPEKQAVLEEAAKNIQPGADGDFPVLPGDQLGLRTSPEQIKSTALESLKVPAGAQAQPQIPDAQAQPQVPAAPVTPSPVAPAQPALPQTFLDFTQF